MVACQAGFARNSRTIATPRRSPCSRAAECENGNLLALAADSVRRLKPTRFEAAIDDSFELATIASSKPERAIDATRRQRFC